MAGGGASNVVLPAAAAAGATAAGYPAYAPAAAAGASLVAGAIDPRSNQPTQTRTNVSTFDPYQGNPSFLGPINSAVLGSLGGRSGSYGSPYVGPSDQQTGALNRIQGYGDTADPSFGESVGQLRKTVGGQYLDPMQSAPFQRLAAARESIARQMFNEFAPLQASASEASGNPYGSSSSLAEVQRGGERIGTQAAQDIASAGWQQYAAERGLQENATTRGLALAPGLAGQVFAGNETLRTAQQAGETEALRANLQAQGYDNQAIANALQYMQLRRLSPINPIVGSTPAQQAWGNVDAGVRAAAGLSNMNQATPPPPTNVPLPPHMPQPPLPVPGQTPDTVNPYVNSTQYIPPEMGTGAY